MCVGNGFIRSERLMNIHGSLNGEWSVNAVGNGLAHSVGEAAFLDAFIMNSAGYSDNLTLCQIIGCGNSASRSERINPFPTHMSDMYHSTRQIPIFAFPDPGGYTHSHKIGTKQRRGSKSLSVFCRGGRRNPRRLSLFDRKNFFYGYFVPKA